MKHDGFLFSILIADDRPFKSPLNGNVFQSLIAVGLNNPGLNFFFPLYFKKVIIFTTHGGSAWINYYFLFFCSLYPKNHF